MTKHTPLAKPCRVEEIGLSGLTRTERQNLILSLFAHDVLLHFMDADPNLSTMEAAAKFFGMDLARVQQVWRIAVAQPTRE